MYKNIFWWVGNHKTGLSRCGLLYSKYKLQCVYVMQSLHSQTRSLKVFINNLNVNNEGHQIEKQNPNAEVLTKAVNIACWCPRIEYGQNQNVTSFELTKIEYKSNWLTQCKLYTIDIAIQHRAIDIRTEGLQQLIRDHDSLCSRDRGKYLGDWRQESQIEALQWNRSIQICILCGRACLSSNRLISHSQNYQVMDQLRYLSRTKTIQWWRPTIKRSEIEWHIKSVKAQKFKKF